MDRSTGDTPLKNGAVTFGWFVQNRYLPLKEADWREETAKVKKYLIQADLVDRVRGLRLENFDKVTLQTHLNQLAKTHSKDRVLQIRSYMRAIFAEAVDQDYLPKDPARTVKPPQTCVRSIRRRSRGTSFARLREACRNRPSRLDPAEARHVECSRPSECFRCGGVASSKRRGSWIFRRPSIKARSALSVKPRESLAKVPIAEDLANEIVEYSGGVQEEGKNTSPDAFMFPGRFGGPMDSSNYPPSRAAQIGRENWNCRN